MMPCELTVTRSDIYRFVPINFIQATTNPIIMSRLKRHIVVFAPGVSHWHDVC